MLNNNLVLLSISFSYHDSSISLSIGREIVVSVELERLFRSKRVCASPTQMEMAAQHVLTRFALAPADVDYLVVNALNNPYGAQQTEEDLSETVVEFLGQRLPTFTIRHHYAHAGFYLLSPDGRALIATCDGGGDLGERVGYFVGDGTQIKRVEGDFSGHTSTTPYGQFAEHLYGEPFCAGKLMGLAAYGKESQSLVDAVEAIFPRLRHAKYADSQESLGRAFRDYKGMARRDPRKCADLAYAVQATFEKTRAKDVGSVYEKGFSRVVLGGGSALNLSANTRIYNEVCRDVSIWPCCDDTGIAVGQNAIAISTLLNVRPVCEMPYLGLTEDVSEFTLLRRTYGNQYAFVDSPEESAERLAANEICICHLGRPEVGPRALGHRSFLMSAAEESNRVILSQHIKQREWYRPVAPIVLEEDVGGLFVGGPEKSQYMLFAYGAREAAHKSAPAIVHVDGTVRVQTVGPQDDPFLYELLRHYKKITGSGVLINTSLNRRGEPISNFLWDTLNIANQVRHRFFIAVSGGGSRQTRE